ncbi:hypothetical protein BH10ACT9_BH10ACT9_61040 [soil metagenome]
MSLQVDLDRLAETLADYTFAYLVTVGDDYRAKAVALSPVLTDGVLDVGGVGAGTRRNVADHDGVTLLWPPRSAGGYTLIVDGTGSFDGETLRVVPTHAVLHRPA